MTDGMDFYLYGNDRVFFQALGLWDDEFPHARECRATSRPVTEAANATDSRSHGNGIDVP